MIIKPELEGLTIKKTFWWAFDLFLIVCFMLFGMVVADLHEEELWVGAVGGLLTHRIVSMILVGFKNYLYGGRN